MYKGHRLSIDKGKSFDSTPMTTRHYCVIRFLDKGSTTTSAHFVQTNTSCYFAKVLLHWSHQLICVNGPQEDSL